MHIKGNKWRILILSLYDKDFFIKNENADKCLLTNFKIYVQKTPKNVPINDVNSDLYKFIDDLNAVPNGDIVAIVKSSKAKLGNAHVQNVLKSINISIRPI